MEGLVKFFNLDGIWEKAPLPYSLPRTPKGDIPKKKKKNALSFFYF